MLIYHSFEFKHNHTYHIECIKQMLIYHSFEFKHNHTYHIECIKQMLIYHSFEFKHKHTHHIECIKQMLIYHSFEFTQNSIQHEYTIVIESFYQLTDYLQDFLIWWTLLLWHLLPNVLLLNYSYGCMTNAYRFFLNLSASSQSQIEHTDI